MRPGCAACNGADASALAGPPLTTAPLESLVAPSTATAESTGAARGRSGCMNVCGHGVTKVTSPTGARGACASARSFRVAPGPSVAAASLACVVGAGAGADTTREAGRGRDRRAKSIAGDASCRRAPATSRVISAAPSRHFQPRWLSSMTAMTAIEPESGCQTSGVAGQQKLHARCVRGRSQQTRSAVPPAFQQRAQTPQRLLRPPVSAPRLARASQLGRRARRPSPAGARCPRAMSSFDALHVPNASPPGQSGSMRRPCLQPTLRAARLRAPFHNCVGAGVHRACVLGKSHTTWLHCGLRGGRLATQESEASCRYIGLVAARARGRGTRRASGSCRGARSRAAECPGTQRMAWGPRQCLASVRAAARQRPLRARILTAPRLSVGVCACDSVRRARRGAGLLARGNAHACTSAPRTFAAAAAACI